MTRNDKDPGVDTTGHDWDGIEELNNPLPRWWLWTFYATIVWGVGYTVALSRLADGHRRHRGAPGLVDPRRRRGRHRRGRGRRAAGIMAGSPPTRPDRARRSDPELAGLRAGGGRGGVPRQLRAVPRRGRGGRAGLGLPLAPRRRLALGRHASTDIATRSRHGIRNEPRPTPAGRRCRPSARCCRPEEIDAVVEHVLAISGQEHDAALAAAGAQVFADNCAACHGEARRRGCARWAPRTSPTRSGSMAAAASGSRRPCACARFGVMPAWSEADRPGGLTRPRSTRSPPTSTALGGGE